MSYLYAVQMLIPNYVYPVKIGFAVNPRKRLAAYTCGPFPVQCLGTWKGKRSDEKAAHRQFAAHRLSGEWFYPHDDLLFFIQHQTGLINLNAKTSPDEKEIRQFLAEIKGHRYEQRLNDVLHKAREVMARYRTDHLSERQLRILLEIPPAVLKEYKRDGEITYTPDAQYTLRDLIDFLRQHPRWAPASYVLNDKNMNASLYRFGGRSI